MVDVLDEAQRIVDRLRQAGLRATADPRNAQPNCCLLERPSMVPLGTYCENLRVEWTLHLLVKGGDNTATWRLLEDMRQQVWDVLKTTITSCEPDTYHVNDTTEIPAYRITFETAI